MLTVSDSGRTSVLCNLYIKQHCFSTDRSLCDSRAFLEKKDITIACGGLTPKIGKFGRNLGIYGVKPIFTRFSLFVVIFGWFCRLG